MLEQRFDDDYATYFLLYDKLNKQKSQRSANVLLGDNVNESNDLTRRGSRGCLTTGQGWIGLIANKKFY